MTVAVNDRLAGPTTGDGLTTAFAYDWYITANTELRVILRSTAGVDTVKTLSTHYTVSGVGDANGGNVTFLTAPASGEKVIIEGVQPKTQTVTYTESANFPAESHQGGVDKTARTIQELQRDVDRALKFPHGETVYRLPVKPSSTTKILGQTTDGEIVHLEAGDIDTDVVLGDGWSTYLGMPASGVLDNLAGIRFVSNEAALTALTTASGLSDNSVYMTLGGVTERDSRQALWIYDSASTATADSVSILAIDGGGAGRFYRWFAFPKTLDAYAGDTVAAKFTAAIADLAGRSIHLTRPYTQTAAVSVPQRGLIDGNIFQNTKGFSGANFTLADQAKLHNHYMDGESATYTGNAVTISDGNNQRIFSCDWVDFTDFNIDFTGDLDGTNFIGLCLTLGRANAAAAAIRLPQVNETDSGGLRRFYLVSGNGQYGYDIGGANFTVLSGNAISGVTFGDDSSYFIADETNRIAQEPTIKGSFHQIRAIWTAPGTVTLASGTNNCFVYIQPGNTLVDNSGVTTNWFDWPDRERMLSTGVKVYSQSADNKTLIQFMSAANNRATIALDASGNVEIATQNSKELQFGIGTADDLIIGATTISSSLDVMPAVTESLDLGSASLEWDNIFLQNAATVSDMRKKIDLGEIDGAQALAYYDKQTPRWFQWKPVVIPAHTKSVNEEYEEEEDFHFREKDAEGVEQIRVVKRMVQKVRPVTVDVPEQVIQHGRRHAGRFAQEVKEAIDSSGIGDFGGYAYEQESDTHVIRPLEDIALLIAAVKHLSRRVAELEGGRPPPPPEPQPEPAKPPEEPPPQEEPEPMREIDIRGTIYKFTAIDALTLMGAFIVNLARDPAEIRLQSGERVTVTIDDVEHIGRQLAGKEP